MSTLSRRLTRTTQHFYPGPAFILPTKPPLFSHKLWVSGELGELKAGFSEGPPGFVPSHLPGSCGMLSLHKKGKAEPRKPGCYQVPLWFCKTLSWPALLCS